MACPFTTLASCHIYFAHSHHHGKLQPTCPLPHYTHCSLPTVTRVYYGNKAFINIHNETTSLTFNTTHGMCYDMGTEHPVGHCC